MTQHTQTHLKLITEAVILQGLLSADDGIHYHNRQDGRAAREEIYRVCEKEHGGEVNYSKTETAFHVLMTKGREENVFRIFQGVIRRPAYRTEIELISDICVPGRTVCACSWLTLN